VNSNLEIVDGMSRAAAAIQCGDTKIDAFVPVNAKIAAVSKEWVENVEIYYGISEDPAAKCFIKPDGKFINVDQIHVEITELMQKPDRDLLGGSDRKVEAFCKTTGCIRAGAFGSNAWYVIPTKYTVTPEQIKGMERHFAKWCIGGALNIGIGDEKSVSKIPALVSSIRVLLNKLYKKKVAVTNNADMKEIHKELQRVAFGTVVALPLKNGLVRVMDNHYDVIKPRDVDPTALYLWLSELPDNLDLQKFNEEWQRFGSKSASLSKTAFTIEVPKSARDHFWVEPPKGNLEFWGFRHPVIVLPGEKITFTFDGTPVAEAVALKTEEPGKTECNQTGRFKNSYKVFWDPEQFRKL
jgi:hypothetical protein